jgi:hypothetical protein
MDLQSPDSIPALVSLSRKIDYLIDVRDSASDAGPDFRRKLIESLQCAFGTVGGPQVEPPQHWNRDRWFLPTAKRQGEHLASLYRDGGRACEYFFHILANPGDEISAWVAGKLLDDPATPWQTHLRDTVAELYRTPSTTTSHLMDLFVTAEDAYLKHLPTYRSGTISMEPIIGDKPGPPLYLTKRFSAEARMAYRGEVERLIPAFEAIAKDVPEKMRVRRIVRCLRNVVKDIDSVEA